MDAPKAAADILLSLAPDNNWRIEDDRKFKKVIKEVGGMTTSLIGRMLNQAVSWMPENEIYLELGVWRGASAICALLGNDHKAVLVDNFSKFGKDSGADVVRGNLGLYNMEGRVTFYEHDFRDFLASNILAHKSVGVYYYDADHSAQGTWDGIREALPYLADQALVFIDDINRLSVREGMFSILNHMARNFQLVYYRQTRSSHAYWWEGFAMLEYSRKGWSR